MISERCRELSKQIAQQLLTRKQTVSVAESTTGGLIAASLLSVAGASGYFLGGSVIYTRASRHAFLDIDKSLLADVKPLTPEMAAVFAEAARQKLNADWGIAELGASGPKDSPYGHPAGSSVFAIAGPKTASQLIQTGSNDRPANMTTFTEHTLALFLTALSEPEPTA